MIRKKLKLATESKSNAVKDGDIEEQTKENAAASNVALTSQYFQMPFWQRLFDIECRLSAELKKVNFHSQNIAAVYNPIEYAADLHCDFLQKYLDGPKAVLFIGMNPGPFGMVQTAVIFFFIHTVDSESSHHIEVLLRKPRREIKIYDFSVSRRFRSDTFQRYVIGSKSLAPSISQRKSWPWDQCSVWSVRELNRVGNAFGVSYKTFAKVCRRISSEIVSFAIIVHWHFSNRPGATSRQPK